MLSSLTTCYNIKILKANLILRVRFISPFLCYTSIEHLLIKKKYLCRFFRFIEFCLFLRRKAIHNFIWNICQCDMFIAKDFQSFLPCYAEHRQITNAFRFKYSELVLWECRGNHGNKIMHNITNSSNRQCYYIIVQSENEWNRITLEV